jgi:hypothetical protein
VVWVRVLIRLATGLGRPFEFISQETFPLPILGGRLKAFAAQLTSGVGFFHIRGLDPQRYSDEVNVVLYLGISSYIGEQRGGQDELGNMLRASATNIRLSQVAAAERIWELTHIIQFI